MSDIAIPKPPRPFKADANVKRLALMKAATLFDKQAAGLRLHGFVVRAMELTERARELREAV